MLTDDVINSRLTDMKQRTDSDMSLWPENCEGSRKALVIFVGPSPGGEMQIERDDIKNKLIRPLWNESYIEPLKWSTGFKVSIKPIVERIFLREYAEASKLIARMNMDWVQNPDSSNVPYYYMWQGSLVLLPILITCKPDLVIPMDEKNIWNYANSTCELWV